MQSTLSEPIACVDYAVINRAVSFLMSVSFSTASLPPQCALHRNQWLNISLPCVWGCGLRSMKVSTASAILLGATVVGFLFWARILGQLRWAPF